MNSATYAEQYEDIYRDYLHTFDITPALGRRLSAQANKHVLIDFGCGTGVQLAKLSRLLNVNPTSVLGIDCAPAMLQKAAANLPTGCQLVNCDLCILTSLTTSLAEFLKSQQSGSLVVLCLGNTIGLLPEAARKGVFELLASVKSQWLAADPHNAFTVFLEFRDADKYGNANSPKVESLGFNQNFSSFYLRHDIGNGKYRVDLYSIRLSSQMEATVELFHGRFSEGYYIDRGALQTTLDHSSFSIEEIDLQQSAIGLGGRTLLQLK